MKRIYSLLASFLLVVVVANGQTIEKKWGFGAGAGGYLNLNNSSLGFSPDAYLSRYLSPSFDVMGNLFIGYFGNKNINEPLDNLNPSLNLRYKFFNGYIMPVESKIQPYVSAGVGYLFDNAETGVNFTLNGGVKYPLSKTFSLFAETGYIHGIPSTRTLEDNSIVDIHDNFAKLILGVEISFIKQPDSDKDGVIDPLDKCPDTPKGATVDEKGCPSDSDGDGVFDGIDKCPNTLPGTPVDEKGCPLDDDGDGVNNAIDKCPDTPKKVKVDDKGCPLDEDGDGVYDDDDKCPGTPAGVEVDKKGCPKDADQDGVSDDKDKCPDTPKGDQVDENGCSLDADMDGVSDNKDKCPGTRKGAVVDQEGCINHSANIDLINSKLHPIYFDTNVSKVTPVQNSKIDNIVEILKEYPEYKVNLYGHADPRGTAEYNIALSQHRVDDVVALLKTRGIGKDRITTKAFGEELAPQGELSEEELQENRKVASYMYIVVSK